MEDDTKSWTRCRMVYTEKLTLPWFLPLAAADRRSLLE